jgi:hypothetical protein
MKVGIVGSRKRNSHEDWIKVHEAFKKVAKDNTVSRIVSGGQILGADAWAEAIAFEGEYDIMIYRAKWTLHGKAAGPIRNSEIAMESDILIACPHPEGKGTQDTIKKFKALHPNGELIIV